MRWVQGCSRVAVSVLLTLGIFWGALSAGSGGEPRAYAAAPARYWSQDEMPEYPGSIEYPLGDGVAVNGVPLRISYFEGKESPDQVRDFFVAELERRGLTPRARPGAGHGWTVAALTEDGSAQIVVAILERGRAGSLVFPAIVPLGTAPVESDLKTRLPLSEHAMGALETTSRDRPGESVITYQEPSQTAASAAARIREEMTTAGWQLLELEAPAGEARSFMIELAHESHHARFSVSAWPGSPVGAAITVHFFSGESRP